MADIVSLEDYKKEQDEGQGPSIPKKIIFHSAYFNMDGGQSSLTVIVHVSDGDVLGVFEKVIEDGGVGQIDENGVLHYLPWPCAKVTIMDA